MGKDADYWLAIGRRLEIEVVAPVDLELAGVQARFTALLPQFGGPAGMIVDANWSAIEPHASALTAAGYGYSCVEAGDAANANLPIAMLADWGWTSSAPKPGWLTA
jgi:hypothetical protein